MRSVNDIYELDYNDTSCFFSKRALNYRENNPYSVTMYQDNNPDLVKERNENETGILIPKIKLDSKSRVLDIACGIARWSDAIKVDINLYCGIDFCQELIEIARNRNKDKENRIFVNGNIVKTKDIVKENGIDAFNRILIVGALMYINDEDVFQMLDGIADIADNSSIICIREPIGLYNRLTLKNHYSEDLKDDYNAIYRTRDEFEAIYKETLCKRGYKIIEKEFMFKDKALNNRKETEQYYWIFERE